jgi:integrase
MARRTLHRLSATGIKALSNRPGMHADGGGLYLQVTRAGVPSWTFRFMRDGKERYMGLGPLHTITLAEARKRAADSRRLKLDGADPIEERRTKRSADRIATAKGIAFKEAADRYIAGRKWRNAKHAAQWPATLGTYAYPVFGDLPVAAIDTGLVLKAIEPIWHSKSETARRVRGRIESILDWATVRGYRTGDNPARWRGHLDKTLQPRAEVQKVEHHAALPYPEIGEFLVELRQHEGIAARALEFSILTAARTGEVIGVRWVEIDRKAKLWTIPGDRMKGGREHRVPLSDAALAIVDAMAETACSDFVFPGLRQDKPLSNTAMLKLIKRMGRSDLTVHGFRSTFRDWCAERTNFPAEVAEMALAHAVGDKVEAAYRRGDVFLKRRQLAHAWAKFCGTKQGDGSEKVVPLRAKRS